MLPIGQLRPTRISTTGADYKPDIRKLSNSMTVVFDTHLPYLNSEKA